MNYTINLKKRGSLFNMKKVDFETTKIAIQEDFRTQKGVLKMNLEYYESTPYSRDWTMQITDHETNREWLKTKITLNLIRVPLIDIYWNMRH